MDKNTMDLSINVSELKNISNSLKSKGDEIKNTYNSYVKKALESSIACFNVSGMDYSMVQDNFQQCFLSISNYISKLTTILDRNVIGNYTEVQEAIKKMFNSDFASELESLLNEMMPPIMDGTPWQTLPPNLNS